MFKLRIYPLLLLLTACVGKTADNNARKDGQGPLLRYYTPTVSTISCTIERQNIYGHPGYGDSPEKDRKDSIYVLKTEQGVNILPDTTASYTQNDVVDKEFGIQHFQLSGLPGGNAEKYLDQEVKITGSFYHG